MTLEKNAANYILDTSKDFSVYVAEHRAIPKITDGLKDGQRKALWLMRNQAKEIKVISLAGQMISSELYLHGDSSASQTISFLAAPYLNNIPLLRGEGNFGTRISPVEGIGAPRYVYVKKSKVTEQLVYQDLDIVELEENHDGSNFQPKTFLPIIPLVLLNGISGIAVGWSTEILPRSLDDLIKSTIDAIDGKKLKRIQPKYTKYNVTIKHLNDNSWEFVGKIKIVDTSTIHIVELPPDLSLDKFKERLIKLEENDEINDWTDHSSNEILIEVKFKRGVLKDLKEEDIIQLLKLKSKTTERIVVVGWDGKTIKQYPTAEELVVDFVNWRLGYYTKRYQKLLNDTKLDILYYKCIKACFDAELPKQLLQFQNKKDLENGIDNICSKAKLASTDDIHDKIASFPGYRWTKEFYLEVVDKIKTLLQNEAEYISILQDNNKLKDIYKSEVLALKGLANAKS